MMNKESPEWLLGRFAEFQIAEWFRSAGMYTIATANIEGGGGAPLVLSKLKNIPVMDLQIASNGTSAWCECKYKDHLERYRIANSWRHGINASSWKNYQEVERITGLRSYLCIYQDRPEKLAPICPLMLLASFDTLREKPIFEKGGRNGTVAMVYWDVDKTEFLEFPANGSGKPDVRAVHRKPLPWDGPARDGKLPREVFLAQKKAQGDLF